MRARSALLALCLAACSNTGSRTESSPSSSPPRAAFRLSQTAKCVRTWGVLGVFMWHVGCQRVFNPPFSAFLFDQGLPKTLFPRETTVFHLPYCWIFCCMNCIETTDTEGDQVIDVVIQSCSCNASTKFDFFGFRWINLEHLPQRWNCNN